MRHLLTQTQQKILEKVKDNILKEETINLISKSEERFNERLEAYLKVMKLHKIGLGDRKIAELTSISRNTINSWIYRGVKPNYRLILPGAIDIIRKLRKGGLNNVEIGNLLNVTSVTVGRLLNSRKIKYRKKTVLSQDAIDYIKTSENPLEFLKDMWLVKINQKSFDSARTFCEFIKLQGKMSFFKLCRKLRKSYPTLFNWKKGKHVPWLINWLELYLKLGKPRDGYVWLPFSLDFRINPTQVVEVPTKIERWEDIAEVIEKLTPIKELLNTLKMGKEECFGFVLGMMIGDVSKSVKRRDRIELQLTKKHKTNIKLGNFFCNCLRKLGFRAYRTKDKWGYRWVSQVSPFFNWIYKVVLGLEEKETTTYTPIKSDWLIETPENIIKRFLQGVYESDGCVTMNNQISCSVDPNVTLIQKLLERFKIKSYIRNEKYREVVIYGTKQLRKTSGLLFTPEIETERYQLLNLIANAKTIKLNQLPIEIKEEIMKHKGNNISQIQKSLLKKYNTRVTRDAIKRVLNNKILKNI